ncbi:MAG: glycoside hydrolase family 97 N-terminal domain-containing protein, partial [Halanaerobiales bacterium]|nr:glycoside hydrolase family 97 N-terminal domain-containing protein [Halanaerobiales bacterium]
MQKINLKRKFGLSHSFLWLLLLIISFSCTKEHNPLQSPKGATQVNLSLVDEQPYWAITFKGTEVINKSPVGLILENPFQGGFEEVARETNLYDSTWNPVWGKFSSIRDHYRETVWKLQEKEGLQRRLDVVVRAYDGGAAIRYKLYGEGEVNIKEDNTSLVFANDGMCWSANGEHPNIGPVKLSAYNGNQFPLTVQVGEHCYASALEAAIFDHAFSIPERIDSTAFKYSMSGNMSAMNLPSTTSWRVVLLGDTPGDLLTNNVMVNLNPSSKSEDFSWVKPGLTMWDWRAWGGKGKDGFTYNLDMASWRRMIDFSSKYGIEYLVLDANWYGHEFDPKSDPMTSRNYIVYQPDPTSPKMADRPAPKNWKDPVDIPALIKYGKERNVGIILYINDVARNHYDFEKTLATYNEWGAAGIKYG